jgi:hypothetical protein
MALATKRKAATKAADHSNLAATKAAQHSSKTKAATEAAELV